MRTVTMPATATPEEGVTMSVPVGTGSMDSRTYLLPSIKPLAFQGQRAQYLPPRFDQVEISSIRWLKHEVPVRVGARKEHHVLGTVSCQVVQDSKHSLLLPETLPKTLAQPPIHLMHEVHHVIGRTLLVRVAEHLPIARAE